MDYEKVRIEIKSRAMELLIIIIAALLPQVMMAVL